MGHRATRSGPSLQVQAECSHLTVYPERSGSSHARPVQMPFPISLTRLGPQNLDSDPVCISRGSVLFCWISPSALNPILKASLCYPGLGICQGQEELGWGVGEGEKVDPTTTLVTVTLKS